MNDQLHRDERAAADKKDEMLRRGQPSTALARVEPAGALAMVSTASEAIDRLRALQEFVRAAMVEGEDYGVIPGTENSGGKNPDGTKKPPKKVLLKPGAEKLAELYNLCIDVEDERPPIERWDGDDPFFAYFKRAVVTLRSDGRRIGSGIGSCNSKEKKYASRWAFDNEVPPGVDISKLVSRDGVGRGGRAYTQYKIPNPEIYDLTNTIAKMAAKRAKVDAVISVTRSAGIFTQDIEDNPGAHGIREQARAKPDVPDAEYEESGRVATPSPVPVSAEVLAARAQWIDPSFDWTPEATAGVVKTLGASPDPNDRVLVWEWRIDGAATAEGLHEIRVALADEPTVGLRADMLKLLATKKPRPTPPARQATP